MMRDVNFVSSGGEIKKLRQNRAYLRQVRGTAHTLPPSPVHAQGGKKIGKYGVLCTVGEWATRVLLEWRARAP